MTATPKKAAEAGLLRTFTAGAVGVSVCVRVPLHAQTM